MLIEIFKDNIKVEELIVITNNLTIKVDGKKLSL